MLWRQYRTYRYLDKDGATREATGMSVVVPIGNFEVDRRRRSRNGSACCWSISARPTRRRPGVRVYLKEFLSDPRVIEDQGLLWKLILNGIILRTRPRTKARDYRKIWNRRAE